MPPRYGGPQLPKELRDQFGDSDNKRGRRSTSRKDARKEERLKKKSQRAPQKRSYNSGLVESQNRKSAQKRHDSESEQEEEIDWDNVTDEGTPPPAAVEKPTEKAPKSILKKASAPVDPEPAKPKISRAVQDRLAHEDAEIAALEKKLGKKGKKKSKGDEGDLDDIFGDLGGFGSDDDGQDKPSKRKRDEDDAWLASKRRKALDAKYGKGKPGKQALDDSDSEDLDGMDELDIDDADSDEEDVTDQEDDDESDSFGSGTKGEHEDGEEGDEFMDEEEEEEEEEERDLTRQVTKVRENPYVAPVTTKSDSQPTKYIPPALRGPPSSDAEALSRLKRQIQGLINRLSEANILSILRDIEQVYQNNPRGYVNTTLVDLLMGMLSDPSALLDTFIILHAGFIAAVYKVVGSDFGAQIVERIVSEFDRHYQNNKDGSGKHTTNLMSLVAELYTFQVIGSNLVFDYVRFFLDELSEINTELLLRIVRAAGPQLRQDDPTALKDIVVLLQKAVAKVGQSNLPVRTKFMIETINDLKNNRMKTGIAASAMSREHTTRMKKQLGTLSTRNLKATEPLRFGLKDVKDTDKKGKWWMVGASWRNDTVDAEETVNGSDKQVQLVLSDDEDGRDVDLGQLARAQRMNTDIRRAIFVSIMSAGDFKDAQIRLNKLNLKKSQETEIPRVIVHCAGAEDIYNPYYTVLARRICADHKSRKSFQFALWDIFKSLGEKQDSAEDSEDESDADSTNKDSLRKLVNQGKLYGTLIGRKALPITSLKNLNFPYMQPKTKTFVEIVLVTAILETQKGSKDKRAQKTLLEVFVEVDQAPEMIAGLQFFLKKVVRRTEIVEGSEKETIEWGYQAVMDMLVRLMAMTTLEDE